MDYENLSEIELERINPSPIPLSAFVRQSIDLYFTQLKGHDPVELHSMVISEVEKPLFESTLAHFGHNQTKAAKALGLSRS
ncbi:MAG: helix-turn-helix domain-containing protein, partial [Gammaproteobacteria bacterium]